MSEAPTEAFGPYLVYEQLGVGGMARVDRAEVAGIEGFHRPIALKRMLPHCAANQDMVKAFVREARLASYLRHGNVAQTYELGKVGETYFIAMELITGPTLRAVLKHCAQTTGPMPVPIALNILNQICDALDYAHNLCDETGQPLGIIHRDVSPSNIIVAEGGVVKLIDFGIAKASAAGMQTMSGTIKGKFGYMAPEYIAGRIDARVDLFAVGVIAHELLTNRPLFSVTDDMETLQRVRSMPLAPPSRKNPQVPPEIDDIVMTALARDPDRRWQHATALRTAMTTVTQRLGLVCHNQQVVEWIAWAFEQTKPRGTAARAAAAAAALASKDSEPSISVEEPPTRAEGRPGAISVSVPPAGPAAGSSDVMTLMITGRQEPPAKTPVGTPARAMPAQSSASVVDQAALGDEYRAAVAAYARHESQAGAVVPGSALAPEHVRTTQLRAAGAGPAAATGAAGAGPAVGAPGAATVGLAAGLASVGRVSGAHGANAPVRARGSQEPANRPLVTLLDGAAAIRSRSESQRLAVPPPAGAPRSAPIAVPGPAVRGTAGSGSHAVLAAPPGPGPTRAGSGRLEIPLAEGEPEQPRSTVTLVILVLLAAAAAAVGTYLVLPYLT